MKQVYIGHNEREMEVTMFFIVISFLFALYRTMKFRIHFCLIVTLFFYLIRSTEYVIILIVERICSISKATKFSKICKY